MLFKKTVDAKKLEKEVKELRAENEKLKEAQKRCLECERYDRRRGFDDEAAE